MYIGKIGVLCFLNHNSIVHFCRNRLIVACRLSMVRLTKRLNQQEINSKQETLCCCFTQ
uniref:Uncharacterized protein n=1 Tax=Arundo donax TaxID=35708 RepID=A0A0A8Z619_ARUDO